MIMVMITVIEDLQYTDYRLSAFHVISHLTFKPTLSEKSYYPYLQMKKLRYADTK